MRGGEKMKNNKGFTLVELLVVIAIIGVLSAVAVVNLNSAREKGIDASRKGNMSALPAAAEVYYDDNSLGHDGFCADPAIDGVEASIAANSGTFDCQDSTAAGDGWVAWVDLEETASTWFCVDWTGAAEEIATEPKAAACACDDTGTTCS